MLVLRALCCASDCVLSVENHHPQGSTQQKRYGINSKSMTCFPFVLQDYKKITVTTKNSNFHTAGLGNIKQSEKVKKIAKFKTEKFSRGKKNHYHS